MARTRLDLLLPDGRVLCRCEPALSARERTRGLLGRDGLAEEDGLLLRPASAVHTAWMRFPIDVVFLDRSLRVLKVVPALRPWRVAARIGAAAVLELPAGRAERAGLARGQRLDGLVPRRRRMLGGCRGARWRRSRRPSESSSARPAPPR